ncbi:MAG TPA: hypothetical protein VEI48_05480 [Candidatus Sulfotelmatobacter sp.]|nr:hypothetical protein [Candidatus Sulfotelmatobacter sp.]
MGAIILPLLLALLLLYVLVYFARAAGQALARSREVTRFQFEAKALLAQVDPILEGLATRTDSARRQLIPPDEILPDLENGTTTLEAARATADRISAPQHGRVLRDAMGEDVDRAIRAVAMIQHGCQQASSGYGRGAELEAQTAVKRGYLNLLHARESLASHVAEAVRLEPLTTRAVRRARM